MPGPFLSVQPSILILLLPLLFCQCQVFQHPWTWKRGTCEGESGRGCLRTWCLMPFPLTLNDTRSVCRDPTHCGMDTQLSPVSSCSYPWSSRDIRAETAGSAVGLHNNIHDTKGFVDGCPVKFMCDLAWFMRAWVTLCKLGALRGNSSEETLQLVLIQANSVLDFRFSHQRSGTYTRECLHGDGFNWEPHASVCPRLCPAALSRNGTDTQMSPVDFLRLVLSTFECDEALQQSRWGDASLLERNH